MLVATVQHYLPEFTKAVGDRRADVVTMHQDAFAAAYHLDEYILLGMAVKYAGLRGRTLMVVGKNRATVR